MANRDQTQKIGFANTNIYQLYKKAKAASAISGDQPLSARVFRADEVEGLKIAKFEPRKIEAAKPSTQNPFEDLKKNMDRLTDLHSRLRFMLKELEDLVAQKK